MTSIITPTLNQSPPMNLIHHHHHHHPPHSPFLHISPFLSSPSSLKFKCFSSSTNFNGETNKQQGGLKDVVYGMVDEQVQSLLEKEENKGLLDGLEKAAERVEIARMELAEIEKQEAEAKRVQDYVKQLEARAAEVYAVHFKCNKKLLREYPNLFNYTKDIYQIPGMSSTVHMEHIKKHYYGSHPSINPFGIIPSGPNIDYTTPHDREKFSN